MMSGHALAASARAAGGESQIAPALGIISWVVAGVVAVLIDRTVPGLIVAAASVVLPLIWLATLDNPIWLLGLAAMAVFAMIAGGAAAAARWTLARMAPHV